MRRTAPRTKTVGIRILKAHLSLYLREVAKGTALEITDRGQPVARLLPVPEEPQEALQGLAALGLLGWSGRKPVARKPVAKARRNNVADLLLEDRG